MTENNKAPEEMLTIAEGARLAGITENALRYSVRRGTIAKYTNATGKLRVSKNEIVDKFLTFKK